MKKWSRTRGWGPFKENWVSICSMHYEYQSTCELCRAGYWHNNLRWWLGHQVYKYTPRLWRWWVNRR